MTTRFLLTCISAYYFHKDVTLDDIHEFIAEDACRLYHEGVEDTRNKFRSFCFFELLVYTAM